MNKPIIDIVIPIYAMIYRDISRGSRGTLGLVEVLNDPCSEEFPGGLFVTTFSSPSLWEFFNLVMNDM